MKTGSFFAYFFLLSFLIFGAEQLVCMTNLNRNAFYLIADKKPIPDLIQLTRSYEQYHLQEKKLPQGVDATLTTTSGVSFAARFFDNKQDRVIILGQGFFRDIDSMQDFIPLLGSDFDYIIFDYRWKDLTSFALNPSTYVRARQKIFFDEKEEILAVTQFVKSRKKYREVIGLGQCYSSFLFMAAQADEQAKGGALFDRLILDSCWYSLKEFAYNVGKDFGLVANPQKGGSFLLKNFCKSYALENIVATLIKCLPDVTIESYATQIKNIPILFVHAMNDKLISIESFARLWQAVQTPKSVLLTPHQHVDNLQPSGIMIHACKSFLQSATIHDFATKMKQ